MKYVYDRMSADSFKAALRVLDMPLLGFCRIFAVNQARGKQWIKGEADIPGWVPVALGLLTLPGAVRAAREKAAMMIRFDNERPELGEFPFLRRRAEAEREESRDEVE